MKAKIFKYTLLAVILVLSCSLQAQVPGTNRSVSAKSFSVEKIKIKKPIYAEVEKRWENSINLQWESVRQPGLQYEGTYRMGKVFALGFGTGYNYCAEHNYHYKFHRLPFYAKAKIFIAAERRVNLFFGVSQGIDMLFFYVSDRGGSTAQRDAHTLLHWIGVGSHTRAEIGCNIRINPKRSFYFSYEFGASPIPNKEWYYFGQLEDGIKPILKVGIKHELIYAGVNVGFTL